MYARSTFARNSHSSALDASIAPHCPFSPDQVPLIWLAECVFQKALELFVVWNADLQFLLMSNDAFWL
jgi:hypothetical protein